MSIFPSSSTFQSHHGCHRSATVSLITPHLISPSPLLRADSFFHPSSYQLAPSSSSSSSPPSSSLSLPVSPAANYRAMWLRYIITSFFFFLRRKCFGGGARVGVACQHQDDKERREVFFFFTFLNFCAILTGLYTAHAGIRCTLSILKPSPCEQTNTVVFM